MVNIAGFEFPEKPIEWGSWEAVRARVTLATKVMVVARTRIEGKWIAYCDAVPGIDHDSEEDEVFNTGTTLPESIARKLFPMFDGLKYAE